MGGIRMGRRAAGAVLGAAMLQGAPMLQGAGGAAAQSFPTRSIRVLVPFGPGSATDIMARTVLPVMAEKLGQPMVIENRAGAFGVVGSEPVARAAPDGYTIAVGAVSSHAIAASILPSLPYDLLRDFTPIGRMCTSANLIVVHPSVPARTLPELIAYSRSRPEGVPFVASSRGTSNGLAGELLRLRHGANLTLVPYTNIGQGLTAVIAGQVPMMIYTVAVLPHVREGRLRAIAVTSERRTAQAPEVPTAIEQGLAGMVADSWFGMFGPARLPEPILARLYEALSTAMADPGVTRRLIDQGLDPGLLGPAAFKEYQAREIEHWGAIVRESGATAN